MKYVGDKCLDMFSAVIAAFLVTVHLVCFLARARDIDNTVIWFKNVMCKCVNSGIDNIATLTRPRSGAIC